MPQYQVYGAGNDPIGESIEDLERAKAAAETTVRNVGEPVFLVQVGRNDWGLLYRRDEKAVTVSMDEIPHGIRSKNKPMTMQEAKSALLHELFKLYQRHGFEVAYGLRELANLAGVSSTTTHYILLEFKKIGVVDFQPVIDSLNLIRLTVSGVQDYEDPRSEIAPFAQNNITVYGDVHGSQLGGTGNTMTNITVSQVLTALITRIETDERIPPEKKLTWIETLRDLAKDAVSGVALANLFSELFG